MKILQVIPFFSPKFGGSVNGAYNLSKELSKRGHKITVITTDIDFDKKYVRELENEGIKIITFKLVFNLASFLYSPSIDNWLKLNTKKFDLIHLHNYRSYQNNVVKKYAEKFNVPYILQAHGSLPLIIEKQLFKKLYDLIWGNKLLDNASKLIAVSNVELEQYKDLSIEDNRIEVIPNGIDIEKFEMNFEYGSFKLKHGISSEFMILYLGRIHKIKGIKFLIEAFEHISKVNNNVTLVIAGPDDGYKLELQKLAKLLEIKNIKFIDYVDNVGEAYYDADVLVYPAIYEIFGLVPFEAILCDTPIVVTKNCGCGELVDMANCGYLVEYGDIPDLINVISNIIKNFDKQTKLIENGKKFISNNLRWEIIGEDIEKVYKSIK